MSKYAAVHEDPQGPGDARPTALQIVKDEDLVGKLNGKVFLITGCSSGLGIETARALRATGATIYATGRNEEKTRAAIQDIISSDPESKAPIHFIKMEMDSFDSVRKGAEEFLKQSSQLNVLICNAGVMATPQGRTIDGFETQFATNHLGHFLLFQLLKSALLASSTPSFPSRVVSVSSQGHRISSVLFDDINFEKGGYDGMKAYGQSKTANIYFANEIERRYGSKGIHATSLHPGTVWTGIATHLSPDMPIMKAREHPDIKKRTKNVEQGAATIVFAAIGKEWSNKGGRYLSSCMEQPQVQQTTIGGDISKQISDEGYMTWAYDEDAEGRLWKESLRMIGMEDDDKSSL